MRKIFAAGLLLIALAGPALAVQPDEILADPALEARARAISAGLRCLVCQNQSIDDSDATLARDLRLLIRERLKAGDSDGNVIAFVVDRYGEFVLLKPRFEAKTIALWTGPFVVVLLTLFILLIRARRPPTAAMEAPLTDAEKAAVRHLTEAGG
jgi:cytochrome c-type biogenesis protein CcmH